MAKAKTAELKSKYFEGVGRRKTSVARVRISQGENKFIVNGENPKNYFRVERYEKSALAPLRVLKTGKVTVEAKVGGGGPMAQSEAIRLGLSRALTHFNPELRRELKVLGFLRRDSRIVERKKFGLKKARRAPQWKKR